MYKTQGIHNTVVRLADHKTKNTVATPALNRDTIDISGVFEKWLTVFQSEI